MSDNRKWAPSLKSRLGLLVVELGLLAVAWYFLKIDELLVGAIAVVIVLSTALPERWGTLASGVGMIGLAGLAHFHYGHRPLAIVLLVFGLVSLSGMTRGLGRR